MSHSTHPSASPAADRLATALRALPPSCGPVRLVAVDGHAGSGKTTFAAALSAALGDAPVVHLDDLATHRQLFEWTERLHREVLLPLSLGRTARHRVYDWERHRFAGVREIPPAPVVLVEGVGAGRRAVRPWLARLIWMDLPAAAARARGEARDGPALAGFWRSWAAAEERHFADDPSRPFADILMNGSNPTLDPHIPMSL